MQGRLPPLRGVEPGGHRARGAAAAPARARAAGGDQRRRRARSRAPARRHHADRGSPEFHRRQPADRRRTTPRSACDFPTCRGPTIRICAIWRGVRAAEAGIAPAHRGSMPVSPGRQLETSAERRFLRASGARRGGHVDGARGHRRGARRHAGPRRSRPSPTTRAAGPTRRADTIEAVLAQAEEAGSASPPCWPGCCRRA